MRAVLSSLLAVVVAAPLFAQQTTSGPSRRQQIREARGFRRLQVPGETVANNVDKLAKLHWHKSLRSASRSAYNKRRPILWIQALGDLKGFT